MREIKFRAWSGPGKQLVALETEFFTGDDGIGELSPPDDIVLMQYTGLKDKNGVEIYEGDVVRYQYPQKELSRHQQLCKVVYEPKAAAFLLRARYFEPQVKYLGDIAKSNKEYDTRTYELCEVIGNIYENPELVKEQS